MIKVYPIKTKVDIFKDDEGIVQGTITEIHLKLESVIYTIEYFYQGELRSLNLYDFQLDDLETKGKQVKIGFKDRK